MNDIKTKRRRLQFHLSTAMVLTFVSGLIIWANVTEHTGIWHHGVEAYEFGSELDFRGYGWPDEFSLQFVGTGRSPNGSPYVYSEGDNRYVKMTSTFSAIFDVFVAASILIFVGAICELWIFWRPTEENK